MNRVCFVVDGLNLYHSLRAANQHLGVSTRWLDIRKLLSTQLSSLKNDLGLSSRVEMGGIYFYTAIPHYLAPTDPDEVAAHQAYIECLKATGITVGLGRFHIQETKCPSCNADQTWPVEKETDINIAVKMMDLAVHRSCNIIGLVTADSDQCPALQWVKAFDDAIKTVVVLPYARGSKELTSACDLTLKLRAESYAGAQFPDPYPPRSGRVINKPLSW